ncbi:MAG: ankyrin repeat domain-containing protein [Candidatus Paceibacterota bacterium]
MLIGRIAIYVLIIIFTVALEQETGCDFSFFGSKGDCATAFNLATISLITLFIALFDLIISLLAFLVRYNKKDPGFKEFFSKTLKFCKKFKNILISIFILIILLLFIGLTKLGYIENYLNITSLYPDTALIENVEKKNLNKIRQLIKDGFNINAANEDKETALMFAADSKEVEIVKELIKAGANVNARDAYNNTPLVFAIRYTKGDEGLETVKELIKAGADVNAKATNQGLPILAIAYNPKIVKELIKAGADVNATSDDGYTILMNYIYGENSLENTQELIKAGANVNAQNNDTALMFAIRRGCTEIAQELIKAGANVNAQNNDLETALMLASRGNIDIVKELIKNNADVNIKNDQNHTALDYAANFKQIEITKILKEAGAK